MFKALLLEQIDAKTVAKVTELDESALPEGEVLVEVAYSSLNYKDGLAVTGSGKIITAFPAVPGIDFSGRVKSSTDPRFAVGDEVILTGWGVGERHWGGMAELARVKGDWLVHCPPGLTARSAMVIGTAGLTAMLCVLALEEGGVTPEQGPVLVTGAAGGVGSVAVALLAKLGYRVTAATGRSQEADYLHHLGASAIRTREEMSQPPRPLEKQLWAGVIDTVGGTGLARALAETQYSGTVTACGLAGSHELPATVMPFILRNVRLQGVDSVSCPTPRRQRAWQRLLSDLDAALIDEMAQEIGLDQVIDYAGRIVRGEVRGRTLVNLTR